MKIGKKKSFILQTSKDSGCLIWMNAYALGKAVTNKIEVSACTVCLGYSKSKKDSTVLYHD